MAKLPVVHDFVRNLITEWRRLELPFAGATIVVAVSGGADSVSLLLGIDELRKRKKLDLRIVAGHFDHRLRPDSRFDLEHVRKLAGTRKFELAHGEWDNSRAGNLEQSARAARYGFLLETAEGLRASHVLTAHTMNDQAETVLMNLIRGSGPEGLGGMHATRILEGGNGRQGEREQELTAPLLPFSSAPVTLCRPLIRWAKRRDTENFCRESGVAYTSDPMNEDLNFRRVWIRKALIPMLQEANPKIVETLCRTAELLRPDAGSPPPPEHPAGTLDLKRLRALRDPDLFPILRDWIRLRRGSLRGIGSKHVGAVSNLIRSPKSGRVAELPGGAVVKHGGRLEWHPKTG